MKFIFISGKRCSGKDTCAVLLSDILEKRGNSVEITSFAEAVKREVSNKHNLNLNRLCYDYEYKHQYRHLLIETAESRKKSDPYYWVKQIIDNYASKSDIVIVSDLRFQVEYNYIHQNTIIRVESSEESKKKRGWIYDSNVDLHISETDLDEIDFDIRIINDGNINDLSNKLASII